MNLGLLVPLIKEKVSNILEILPRAIDPKYKLYSIITSANKPKEKNEHEEKRLFEKTGELQCTYNIDGQFVRRRQILKTKCLFENNVYKIIYNIITKLKMKKSLQNNKPPHRLQNKHKQITLSRLLEVVKFGIKRSFSLRRFERFLLEKK